MARRTIEVDGQAWRVEAAGRTTQSSRDELAVRFRRAGDGQERLARVQPRLTKDRERALALLTDAELRDLLAHSQPSWTSPELGYRR
jgi:hypothetical protein